MNADPRDLFAAAAAEERAAARPLDVAVLLGRAHRRRTVRAAGYSAVGLGTAAAIAVGALSADGLWRDDSQPVPPATNTPDPRPSSQPTASAPAATAAPLPEQAFEPAWDLCGRQTTLDMLSGYEDPADGSWFWLSADEVPTPPPADLPFSLRARVSATTDRGDVEARLTSAYLMAEPSPADGSVRVVAVAAVPVDAAASGVLRGDGSGLALPAVTVPFTACESSPLGGGDGALDRTVDPHGLYYVTATAEVTTPDGTSATVTSVVASIGVPPEVTPTEPVLTMTGTSIRVPADRGTTSTTTEGAEYWCGAHASATGPAPDGVPDGLAAGGTAFRENGELIVHASLTNTSGGTISDSWLELLSVTVVRDGRQIGMALLPGSLLLPAAWAPGTTVDVEMSAGPWTCTFMRGEPWPAGQYELRVNGALAQPRPFAEDSTAWIDAGPFPFTLE